MATDFSVIANDPQLQNVVQTNALERAFKDMLFPNMIFRMDVEPENWEANVGDNRTFTAPGPIPPNLESLPPMTDPVPASYSFEQWVATMGKYANTIDTPMPTSMVAIASLFMRNSQQLGLNAAQSMNRKVRNAIYAGALSGQTTVTTGVTGTTVHVDRLNGFTTARRPDLPSGSPVQFAPVSANNPLPISCGAGLAQTSTVTGFSPDSAGDQVGPGNLTLSSSVTVNARDPFVSTDASFIIRSGGGQRTDDVTAANTLNLQLLQSAVGRLRTQNVPPHADGRYHVHLDPISEQECFSDQALRDLLKSLPEYYMVQDFVLGQLYGMVFYRNSECPLPFTVNGQLTATYQRTDNFAGLIWGNNNASTGTQIHYPVVTGGGWIKEFYPDLGALITDAGIMGKIGKWQITNNGIEVMAERIKMIFRSPMNRTQDVVSNTWMFLGDWPIRTDVLVGDAARYKRGVAIEHA